MDASTFLPTVLVLYFLYYAALLSYDRIRFRTSGHSSSASHREYRLDAVNDLSQDPHTNATSEDAAYPDCYFREVSPLSSTEHEYTDLGIDPISDDGIEVTDENLHTYFKQQEGK
jgi:hypothetical protein